MRTPATRPTVNRHGETYRPPGSERREPVPEAMGPKRRTNSSTGAFE
jgi:hypothetical protein